jgi:glutathione S-transferase
LKFYHAPQTCTDGIIVILEEIGAPYSIDIVDFARNEQSSAEFLALNPAGKVPVLVLEDGTVLTQWTAIAAYLGRLVPGKELLSTSPVVMARTLQMVDYITGTAHGLGFTRIVRPGSFAEREDDYPAAAERGHTLAKRSLEIIDQFLGAATFLAGGSFSIADAALFYIAHWSVTLLGYELPDNCKRHYAMMLDRPSVQRLLKHA